MGKLVIGVIAALAVGFGLGVLTRPSSVTPAVPRAPAFALGLSSGPSVATFDGGALTEEELRAFLATAPPEEKPRVEEALATELAADQALAEQTLSDPLVAARVKRALADGWLDAKLKAAAKSAAGDEAAQRQWYEAHRAEFSRPERIIVQEAVITTPAGKEREAISRAKALEKTGDAEGFVQEGRKLGVVRERAITLPELESDLGKEKAAAAFQMVRVGEVRAFPATGAVRVLRLLRRESPLEVPFEQARAQITSRRWFELRAETVESLRTQLAATRGVKLDQAAAERVMSAAPK